MPIVRITLPAEKRALREKMRALGLDHREIAAEFARRYRLRPRAAWREAHGWSLREAAAQINAYTGTVGLDPGGISSVTARTCASTSREPAVRCSMTLRRRRLPG